MTRCVRGRLVVGNALALLALLAAGACDEAPTPLTRPTMVVSNPNGPFVVTVVVQEFRGASLPAWVEGATVEVLSSSDPAQSATTDGKGMCQLKLNAGPVTIRARKDDYDPESVTVDVRGDTQLSLTLSPRVRGELGGRYTLTVSVAPGCDTLPAPAREISYNAHVVTEGESVHVSLRAPSGGDMVTWGCEPGLFGTRTGETVRFTITDDLMVPYCFISRIPQGGDLYHAGQAEGEYRDDTIVARFDGWIGLTPSWQRASNTGCYAPDHRLVFRR